MPQRMDLTTGAVVGDKLFSRGCQTTHMTYSRLAARLFRLLTERPGRFTIDEFKRDLRASKTAIARALGELEDAGIIRLEEE